MNRYILTLVLCLVASTTLGQTPVGAPVTASYITKTPVGALTSEQALSDLATGLVKNTTGTGTLSIAVAGTDYINPSIINGYFADPSTNASFNIGEWLADLALDSPVIRREPDGDITLYGKDAANAAAVGDAIVAAKDAASSGDVIAVYADNTLDTNLAKDGVNWKFATGVTSSWTGNITGFMFDDGGVAMSFVVGGDGNFVRTPAAGGTEEYSQAGVLNISHASSDITFHFNEATLVSGATVENQDTVFNQEDGRLTLHGNKIIIDAGASGYGQFGIWWDNGELNANVKEIVGTRGVGIETWIFGSLGGSAPSGNFRLSSERLESTLLCYFAPTNANIAAWVSAKTIVANSTTNGGKLYINCQKWTGSIAADSVSSTSLFYLTTQKIDGDFASESAYITNAGARMVLDVLEFLPGTNSGSLLVSNNASAVTLLRGGDITAAINKNAVSVSNGTVNLLAGKITTSGSGNDLVQSGGTINVGPGVAYSSLKTSGTITLLPAWGVTPGAGGLAILDDVSTSAIRTTLTLVPGTDVQGFDGDLTAIAALSGTDTIYRRSAANTWSAVTIGSGLSFSGGTLSATGSGAGTLATIKENDVSVDTDIGTLDFLGADFDLTESPENEVNISISSAYTTDAELASFSYVDEAPLQAFADNPTNQGDFDPINWRTGLGLVIGTNVQAFDADLTDLADGTLTGSKVDVATLDAAITRDTEWDTWTEIGTAVSGTVPTAELPAASDTAQGAVELATAAETTTGTDAVRAVTPDGLAGSDFGLRYSMPVVFDWTTDLATGDGKFYIPIPPGLNGWNLVYVHHLVITAGTTGTTDVQVARVRSGSPADMLSTKLTIDSTETGSNTAATPAVIDTSNDDLATNDILRIDYDAVSTTAPKGSIITLGFQKP